MNCDQSQSRIMTRLAQWRENANLTLIFWQIVYGRRKRGSGSLSFFPYTYHFKLSTSNQNYLLKRDQWSVIIKQLISKIFGEPLKESNALLILIFEICSGIFSFHLYILNRSVKIYVTLDHLWKPLSESYYFKRNEFQHLHLSQVSIKN